MNVMKNRVKVKSCTIGEGAPKVCVPMVGKNREEVLEEARLILDLPCDVIEWRVDFLENAADLTAVNELLDDIRKILPDLPMIFTFRNKEEGGMQEISLAEYARLNRSVMASGQVDLVDVELMLEEDLVRELVAAGREHGVAVIISNHDFQQTPPKEVMINQLKRAAALGADIAKLAVMPKCAADVGALQEATRYVKHDLGIGPLITMSMGGLGIITRLSGEVFGSDLTFGAAKKASAPGQIAVGELKKMIELLHNNL